jgi:hypothetical protein
LSSARYDLYFRWHASFPGVPTAEATSIDAEAVDEVWFATDWSVSGSFIASIGVGADTDGTAASRSKFWFARSTRTGLLVQMDASML